MEYGRHVWGKNSNRNCLIRASENKTYDRGDWSDYYRFFLQNAAQMYAGISFFYLRKRPQIQQLHMI